MRIFSLTLICGHEMNVISLSPTRYYCVSCAKLQLRDFSVVANKKIVGEGLEYELELQEEYG